MSESFNRKFLQGPSNDFLWPKDGIPGSDMSYSFTSNPSYNETFVDVLNHTTIEEIISQQKSTYGQSHVLDLMGNGFIGTKRNMPSSIVGLRLGYMDRLFEEYAIYNLELRRHLSNPYRYPISGDIFLAFDTTSKIKAVRQNFDLILLRPLGPFDYYPGIDKKVLNMLNKVFQEYPDQTLQFLQYVFMRYFKLLNKNHGIIIGQIPGIVSYDEYLKEKVSNFFHKLEKKYNLEMRLSFHNEFGDFNAKPSFYLETAKK